MESSLRQIEKEKGEASLAGYIKNFNASVKGVAIQEPQSTAENEVRLRVEFVYADRNEAQIYYLQRSAAKWQIARQENTEGVKVIMPYGAPVE
jgi:primosomal protein N''